MTVKKIVEDELVEAQKTKDILIKEATKALDRGDTETAKNLLEHERSNRHAMDVLKSILRKADELNQ